MTLFGVEGKGEGGAGCLTVFRLILFSKSFILAVPCLRCCTGFLWFQWGLLFTAACGFLTAGPSCCGARALDAQAVAAAYPGLVKLRLRALECRLSSCGART